MAKASETTGAVADLIRLVSAVATSECYSIAGKMSELKAEAMTAETEETTAMAKAGGDYYCHGFSWSAARRRRRCQAVDGGEEGPS